MIVKQIGTPCRIYGMRTPVQIRISHLALVVICLLAATLLPCTSNSQDPYFSGEMIPVQPSIFFDVGTAVGDVDLDGDLDIFIENDLYLQEDHDPLAYDLVWNAGGFVRAVILSDMDGDGYPDIVLGKSWLGGDAEPNIIHLNGGPDLPHIFLGQNWWITAPRSTRALAVADMNEDGRLDVYCGNITDTELYPDTGYLNGDEGLPSTPTWIAGANRQTTSLAVADLDGDTDLDLVCGESGGSSVVYRNPGSASITDTIPDTQPCWISHDGPNFHSVCLGDLDGDGDMDLVSGGALGIEVFWNEFNEGNAAIFDSLPDWTTEEVASVTDLSLADIDKDGDLDLMCSTHSNHENILLLNTGAGAPFSVSATWPQSISHYLRLADFNQDGFPDVLFTNQGADCGIYLNRTDPLAKAASRPILFPTATRGVALGDIDNDGDLDLVAGNDGQSQLFVNDPQTYPEMVFSPVSSWSNNYPVDTHDIVLADIDTNGYLDVITGNYNQANHLYLNDSGVLGTSPDWLSNESDFTVSLAAGDVNQDGYCDLVAGNLFAGNRLYLNTGGALPEQFDWTSTPANDTRAVVLGDVDGDGYLDLVCGNAGQGNTFYLFQPQEQEFSRQPDWQTRPGWYDKETWCLALGDVDGDGNLDLVCGNDGQENTLYLGSHVTYFTPDPVWYSNDASPTRCLLLTDVDGDGDLDLVCGNHGQATVLYRNENNRLSEDPVWYSDDTAPTTCLAGGDIDRDGDFDLVVGNDGTLHGIHYGVRHPVYLGDPSNPNHHLPDNPVYISRVDVSLPTVNTYRFTLTAIDIEADPFWLRVEYRYSDSPNWRVIDSLRLVGPLETLPVGREHEVDWDVSQLVINPPSDRPLIVRLVAIPVSKRVVLSQSPTAYQLELPSLEVRRAEIAATPDTVQFAGVTLGDTVRAVLSVTNIGNELLDVRAMDFPSSEMWLLGDTTFTVQPGESHIDTLCLGPRVELIVAGDLGIVSNAPRMPTYFIPVQADIRALTVKTTPLLEGDTAPLGEALTIHVLPDSEVNLERCALNYRPVSSHESFTRIEMTQSGGFFIGVIPGPDVTEAGLEYFIVLENSGVFATDPPDTSVEFFSLAVAAPALITAQPLPTSGADFLEGREIVVQVSLAQGVVYEQGTLNYRRGGDSQYTSIPIPEMDPLPIATIPDSVVGPRGVEYWVQVQTNTSALTDPPADPANAPHTIRVRVLDLAEPMVHAGYQYRMVSVPLDFGVDFTGTLESLLSDQSAFGPYPAEPYNLGQWRCFRGFPPEGNSLELPAGSPEDFRVQPGRGFWLISRDENWIATSPVAGTSTLTDRAFDITLEPGWNMIGHPFSFPVSWSDVLVDGLPPTPAEIEGPWFYDGTPYIEASALEPFAGYWILNNASPPRNLVLAVPPRESSTGKVNATTGDQMLEAEISWQMTLTAFCAGVHDGSNRLGVAASASDSWDRHDRHEPPPAPTRSLSLYFPHISWAHSGGYFTVDLRSEPEASDGGHFWRFDVAKNFVDEGAGDSVHLEFSGLASIPIGLEILLVDRELLRNVDLRERRTYSFYQGHRGFITDEAGARFQILVGSTEFIAEHTEELPYHPTLTALYQNRPNPFNPSTVIRYDIAQAGNVRLCIYDLNGARVKILVAEYHDPGRYEIVWQGEDDQGRRVASGVYFIQLQDGTGSRETRKTLLMK